MDVLLQQRTYASASLTNYTFDCEDINKTSSFIPYEDKRGPLTYTWDLRDVRIISNYLFFAYSIAEPVGGYLSDRYGGKYVVATSLLTTSVLVLLQPQLILVTDGAFWFLKVLRIVQGLFYGLHVVACISLIAHWVPSKERTFLYSLTMSGFLIGSTVNDLVTEFIIKTTKDWTLPFYIYGGMGLVMVVIWCVFVDSTPQHSRFINEHERSYLDNEMMSVVHAGGIVDHEKKVIPVMRIFKSLDFWSFAIGIVGHIWIWYFSLIILKTYLGDIVNIRVEENMLFKSLPPFMMFLCSWIFGWFSDWVVNHKYINLTTVRKTFTNIGILGCPIYMIAATYAGCNTVLLLVLFTIALGLEGCAICGIRLVALDLSPNYAGFLTGVSEGIAVFAGVTVSVLQSQSTIRQTVLDYRKNFTYMLMACCTLNLVFIVFGRTNLQAWNKPPKKVRSRRN